MNKIYDEIIKNLKELRISSCYTQREVANFLNVSRSVYGRYETGERTIPIDLLDKLADFYGITLDELVGRF